VLISLFIPPLRALIALRALVMLLGGNRGERTAGAAKIAFWLVVMAIMFGSWAVLYFESSDPQANINTYGKALWWSCVTVTTVGYGDYTPVTTGGRCVAVLLMFIGVGLISTVSATIASGLISATKKDRQHRSWRRSFRRADALIGPDSDVADQPGQPQADDAFDASSIESLDDIEDAAADSDDAAVRTLGILVDAIDRLQKEVAALRTEASVSVAGGTNVTTETIEKPDTSA
jgi:hypothetical protein